MHKIQVALLPELITEEQVQAASLAIVIDTLRFTTSAVAALQAGAKSVRTCQKVSDARKLGGKNPDWLLCGERDCKPIDGFTLGNSPLEYVADSVASKELVFTTTNGTRAVAAALPAARIVLASLTNRAAVCELLKQQPEDQRTIIFCAGTDGLVAMEDVMTAGAILQGANCVAGGDSATIAAAAWEHVASRGKEVGIVAAIAETFCGCRGGASLVEKGYAKDLDAAAQLDSVTAIPVAERAKLAAEGSDSSVCFRRLGR